MSNVFVTQEPLTREGVPIMDLSPALKFGDLQVLLPSGPVILSTPPMVKALQSRLDSFSDSDYLLGIGDPAIIAAAVMVASSKNNGRVNLLRWDRIDRCYRVVKIDLYPSREES